MSGSRLNENEAEDELRTLPLIFFSPLSEPVCVKLMAATLTMDQTLSTFALKQLKPKSKTDQQRRLVDGVY